MIQITETAAAQFVKLTEQNNAGFRLSLISTGCNGYSYKLESVATTNEDDHLFQSFGMIEAGIALVVADDTISLLDGMTIDFVRKGFNESFEYTNPNVSANCGCGSSVTF
jgi:iron-sulfur cluster assembly protein